MTPEGRVKHDIRKMLDKRRPHLWYYCAQDRFTSAIMDLIVCYKGKFVALEVKRPTNNRGRKLQEYVLSKIRVAGGTAHVVQSVDDVEQIFTELDRE